MLTKRDQAILTLLRHFRVLSRDQLAKLVCPETARPWATINRIMKRLDRDGHVITVPRPKDQCYLYMPNPVLIHTESSKVRHFLAIADLYIQIGKPRVFAVEPQVTDYYRPDAYTRLPEPVMVEVQRSHISNKKMQEKVDQFVQSYREGKHDARTLWIVANEPFKISCPDGFRVELRKLKEGVQ